MHSSNFEGCCGINIISGFPFDDGDQGLNDWSQMELNKIIASLPELEGTYCECHMIALNHAQTSAMERVLAAGYQLTGEFLSAHDNGRKVLLFTKGLTVYPVQSPPPKKKIKKARKSGNLKSAGKKGIKAWKKK